MKKVFIVMFVCSIFQSCITIHNGTITPSTVILKEKNFTTVRTIQGSASATYILGIGGNLKKGLVNEAKKNMYSGSKLLPNQAITNVTYDISRQVFILGVFYRQTCYISADVVEFGYLLAPTKSEENFLKNRAEEKSVLTKKDSEGFVSGPHKNYFKGEIVIFKIGAKFYKAKVSQDSKGRNMVAVENFYEKINSNWSLQKNATSKSIPASYIQSKKTP